MTTVALVVIAAVVLFVLLLGSLFGVVWFAGQSSRKSQVRG
ncbi:hypothetical protein [Nocardioides sp. Root190]|nr:hypothetical protein [Nocardioides sp. Root190]